MARFGEHEHLERHVENSLAVTPGGTDEGREQARAAFFAAEEIVVKAVAVLAACGWPVRVAEHAIGLIAARLIEAGDRRRAHEYLRRDRQTPQMLGLDQASWCALLTMVLGTPAPKWEHTASGHGLLRRLAGGVLPDELLLDAQLVARLIEAAPAAGSPAARDRVPGHAAHGVIAHA